MTAHNLDISHSRPKETDLNEKGRLHSVMWTLSLRQMTAEADGIEASQLSTQVETSKNSKRRVTHAFSVLPRFLV